MSNPESASAPTPPDAELPNELPPVQPPSAGFIVQLFLIPALIVAAVIGVWLLFGKLAGGEQDVQELIADLGSSNEHRRWRAANGLAHKLSADQQRMKELSASGATSDPNAPAPLASNRTAADALVKLFEQQLGSKSPKPKDILHQEYLAKTLGYMDVHDLVLPALQKGCDPDHDTAVRTSSMGSIARITHRAAERGEPIDDESVAETLIDCSADELPLIRQFCAFAMGLVDVPKANDQLTALLADADQKTRINAAIGLARHKRAEGYDVFHEVLTLAQEKLDTNTLKKMNDTERQATLNDFRAERPLMLRNAIKALTDINDKATPEQRAKTSKLLTPIAETYEHPELKMSAKKLLKLLKG